MSSTLPDVTLKYVKVHRARAREREREGGREMHVKVGNCKDVCCLANTYSRILTHPIRPCPKECHWFQLKNVHFSSRTRFRLSDFPAFIHSNNARRRITLHASWTTLPLRVPRSVLHTSSSRSRGQSNWRRRQRWLSREKNDASWRNVTFYHSWESCFYEYRERRFSTNKSCSFYVRENQEKIKRKSIEAEGVNLVRIVTVGEFNGLQIRKALNCRRIAWTNTPSRTRSFYEETFVTLNVRILI